MVGRQPHPQGAAPGAGLNHPPPPGAPPGAGPNYPPLPPLPGAFPGGAVPGAGRFSWLREIIHPPQPRAAQWAGPNNPPQPGAAQGAGPNNPPQPGAAQGAGPNNPTPPGAAPGTERNNLPPPGAPQVIMEVPGKKLQREASFVDRTFCQPCSQDGDTLPAEAYCTVCKEFLCTTCVNAHRKLKITKGHALLDKSKMPTSMSDQDDEDECTEPSHRCDIHPTEFIKYFCSDHQTLNCGHCLAIEHRSCRVDVISDVAKAFKEGQEYDDITKTIQKILEIVIDYSFYVERNIKLVATTGRNEIARLRRYREEVNKYFDKQESSLLKIIEQMKNKDETLLDSLKLKSEGLKSKLQEFHAQLEAQSNSTQMFIEAKRVQKQLEGAQIALADLIKENTIHHYEFRKDTVTERLLTSDTGLGTVIIISPETILSVDGDHGLLVPTALEGETMAAEQPTWTNFKSNKRFATLEHSD